MVKKLMKIRSSLGCKMILRISVVVMLALGCFFYLHIKEDHSHFMALVEDEAYRLGDIIKKSIKHYMLLNQRMDLQQTLDELTSHDEILKTRIIERGKVKISSDHSEVGQFIDEQVEACTWCHWQNKQPEFPAFKNYRSFKDTFGRDVIGIVNPIYNEAPCYPCHGQQEKILGVLDIIISLEKVNILLRDKRNKIILFLALTFVLISVTVGLLIQRLVIVPIHTLGQGTAMITSGNLDYQISVNTGDEIGELAQAYNIMTSRLKSQRQEIENWNKELENRVTSATTQLASANKELEITNRKLKESDQKKSEMMMTVAHDIRAPLSAAISCLRVVLDGYLKSDPPKEREMLKRVEGRIKDQIAFAQKLLDFSCLAESSMEREELDLNQVIRKVKDSMSSLARSKDISIEVQPAPHHLPISGNEELLTRALTNLVDNSITYCPKKSKIRICCRCLHSHIELEVKDNGPGIPSDELPKIFEVLFRGRRAKRQPGHGAGLGLSIVKRVVEGHQGTVSVESKEEEGTRFSILLPRY